MWNGRIEGEKEALHGYEVSLIRGLGAGRYVVKWHHLTGRKYIGTAVATIAVATSTVAVATILLLLFLLLLCL